MRGNVLLLSLITLLPIGVGCDGATTLKVEGGAASGVASAGHCGTILASSYDQSCTAGTDCVPEPDGDFCGPSRCTNCPTAAVNAKAQVQYEADLASKISAPAICPCPSTRGPVCSQGKCAL